MAGLSEIRTAIKTTIESAVSTVKVYPVVEAVNVIAQGGVSVVVLPQATDFLVAMGRGTDTYTFALLVMANPGDPEIAQNTLDAHITGAGSSSIRAAVFAAKTLGLANTDAHISGMSGYGGRFESAGIDHIGAVLTLIVHTVGTS